MDFGFLRNRAKGSFSGELRRIEKKLSETNAKVTDLKEELANISTDDIIAKNEEQDQRIQEVAQKYENIDIDVLVERNDKQDAILKGLFNENADDRMTISRNDSSINMIYSKDGVTQITEIQGKTLTNLNNEPDKEIELLAGAIDVTGEGEVVTINGNDGGSIDIFLEGKTMVNVSSTKEETGISEQRTVENTVSENTEYDGVYRPELYGDTMVNLNKDVDKELTLMSEINEQGEEIEITQGKDGGLVDVYLEGNTMVNVCDQEDSVPLTMSYIVENSNNHITFQGEFDGKAKPYVYGNTMVNLVDQEESVPLTKSYTVENSGNHIALQGEYDGKAKPYVYGNTLVNLQNTTNLYLSSGEESSNVFNVETGENSIKITGQNIVKDGWRFIGFRGTNISMFKPNTTYTIAFDKIVGDIIFIGILKNDGTGHVGNVVNYKEGKTVYTFTTGDSFTATDQLLYFNIKNDDLMENFNVEIVNPIILEGDYTNKPIPNYFTGLQSSFEDNLVPIPINIIDIKDEYKVEGYLSGEVPNSMVQIWNGADAVSYIIPCSPNTTYTFNSKGNRNMLAEFSSYPTHGMSAKTSYGYIKTSSNAAYLMIYVNSSWTDKDLEVQFGEGIKHKVDYVSTGKNKLNPLWLPECILNSETIAGVKIDYDGIGKVTLNGTCTENIWGMGMDILPYLKDGVHYTSDLFFVAESKDGTKQYGNFVIDKSQMIAVRLYLQLLEGETFNNSVIYCNIEEGDRTTEYEPFKQSIKTLYLNSPLLEGDSIEVSGNDVYHVHRYAKVVLDGSENWRQTTIEGWNKQVYEMMNSTLGIKANESNTAIPNIVSDILPTVDMNKLVNHDVYGITVWRISSIESTFFIDVESVTNVDGFKQWLSNNPTTVVYALATPTYEVISSNDNLYIDSYVNGHLDFDSAVPVEKVVFNEWGRNLEYIKPSTNYIVQFESDNAGKLDVLYTTGQTYLSNTNIVKGLNRFEFTTNSTFGSNWFTLHGIGCNISNIVVTEATDKQFGYFKGMSSSFEDNLVTEGENAGKYKVDYVSTGKNKYNFSKWADATLNETSTGGIEFKDNKIIITGGEGKDIFTNTGASGAQIVTDSQRVFLMNAMPNQNYVLSFSSDTGGYGSNYIALYDKNYNLIGIGDIKSSSVQVGRNEQAFKTTSNTAYVGIRFGVARYEEVKTIDYYNVQIEEGTVTTEYEPFKQTTKTLYLNSPLLEGDSIEVSGNDVYHVHRYAKVVLDGSADEGWGGYSNLVGSYTDESLTNFKVNLILNDKGWSQTNSYCDRFRTETSMEAPYWRHYECIGVGDNQIILSTNKASDEEELKTWLSNNPTTVVYALATPTYEVISPNDNLYIDSYVNGHLDFDSAVPIKKVVFTDHGFGITYVKTSTDYNIQFEADGIGKLEYLNLAESVIYNMNLVKGVNKFTIRTLDSINVNGLFVTGIGCNISNIVVTEAVNEDFGYFQGMKSVGECEELEVRSKNRNLLERIRTTNEVHAGVQVTYEGDTMTLNGTTTNAMDFYLCPYDYSIPLKKNTKYTVSWEVLSGSSSEPIFAYKSKKADGTYFWWTMRSSVLQRTHDTSKEDMESISSIRIYCPQAGVTYDNFKIRAQVEEGDTATSYVKHQSQTQQLTHEPLRAVGDVKDRYVLIDGEWYIERNCGIVDINADWYKTDIDASTSGCRMKLPSEFIGDIEQKQFTKTVSNIFPSLNKWSFSTEGNFISTDEMEPGLQNKGICIRLSTDMTAEQFKTTYKDLEIVYILATSTYEKIDYNPLSVYKDMTHITTNSTIPCNITIKNHGFNAMLKPSTTYTIVSNQGNQTIVTKSTLDDSLRFYGEGKINNVRVLEGNVENIPSHFDGIESAFEQSYDETVGKYKVEIKTVGKNLFNIESWRDADIYKGTHVVQGNNIIITATGDDCYSNTGMDITGKYVRDIRRRYVIPVKPNTTYTLSYNKTAGGQSNYYCLIDSDYYVTYYKGLTKTTDDGEGTSVTQITTGNDTRFIGFRLGVIHEGETITYSNIQLEEGDTATAYEPYKSSTISFYLDEPLRGIGDVRDDVKVQDGKVIVTRRCGEVILDGSEPWYAMGVFDKARSFGSGVVRHLMAKSSATGNYTDLLSDRFKNSLDASKGNVILRNNNPDIIISVNNGKLSTLDIAGFEKWLSENPVKVVYQLAEPTVETIDNASLSVNGFADGHIFFDTRIPLSKVEFKPFEEELKYLYPSKVYNVQFVADQIGLVDITLGGARLSNQVVSIGLNKFRITTPTNLVDNKLIINGKEINISNVVVCDSIDNYGYFEGMKSVGEGGSLEIKSCNKNIIDDNLENWELLTKTPTYTFSNEGKTISVTYTEGWNHGVILTTRLKKGTYYCGLSKTGNVDMYYNDGTTNDVNISNKTFTISSDTVVNFKLKNTSSVGGTYTVSDVYINKLEDLGYIPHQSNSQIMTHEPLRAIGNIRDKYVLKDGNWYIERNCAEVVLDGDLWFEGMYKMLGTPNTEGFYTPINTIKPLRDVITTPELFKCDILKSGEHTWHYLETDLRDEEFITLTSDGRMAIRILKSKLSEVSTNGISQWLSQNPITVVYPLSAPVLEEIDYNPFEIYSEKCYITTDSVIPPTINVKASGFDCALLPNTTYTLSYTIDGVPQSRVVTISDKVDNIIRLYGQGRLGNMLVLEGVGYDTNLPEVLRGMESTFSHGLVTDENDENYGKYKMIFKVIGKNKFNKANLISNTRLNVNDGKLVEDVSYDVTDFIPVSPNTTYIADNVKNGLFFTANKSKLNKVLDTEVSNVFVTPSNAHYVMFNLEHGIDDFEYTQIETGDVLTDYEEYVEDSFEMFIDKPLMGIGNTYDRIFSNEQGMFLERRFDEFNMKEDTTIDYLAQNTYGLHVYRILHNFTNLYSDNIRANDLTIRPYNLQNNIECISVRDNHFVLFTYEDTVEKVRERFAHLKIVYPLASSQIEELKYPYAGFILDSYNKATLHLNTNMNGLVTVTYSCSIPNMYSMNRSVENLQEIDDEQDSVQLETAYKLAVLEILTGINTDDF